MTNTTLARLCRYFASPDSPIVAFNKSHPVSRLVVVQDEVLRLIEPTMLAMGCWLHPRDSAARVRMSEFRHGLLDRIRRLGSNVRA